MESNRDEDGILKMMNGFVDFMNGLNGTHLPNFNTIEDVNKFMEERARIEEKAKRKG